MFNKLNKMKMISILLIGLIAGILLVGSGCCEREPIDDVQNITTQEKSKVEPKEVREIVDRTYTTDTYDNKDGTYSKQYYAGAVNIWYWDEFIPVEDYLNPVISGDGLVFNDPHGNKIIGFEMNYEKENVLSLSNSKIEFNSFRGGYYFTTDADTEVKSMEYELSSDYIDEFEYVDDKLMVNDLFIDFGMAKEEQNITTKLIETITYEDKEEIKTYKLNFSIEEGKTGSLKMIDPTVTYDHDTDQSDFVTTGNDDMNADSPPPTYGASTPETFTSDSALDSSDNSRVPVGGGGSTTLDQYSLLESIFTLDGSIAEEDITAINWTIEAMDYSYGYVYIYLYNHTSSSYYECGSIHTWQDDSWVSCYIGDTPTDFINLDDITFAGQSGDPSLCEWDVDYLVLELTYLTPPKSLNLTYPTSLVTKSVTPEDNITIYFNVTSGDNLVTSGVTPFNITIGTDEAVIKTHEPTGDLFKFRSDNDDGSGTISFGALDDASYAALITPKSDTDTPYSCTYLSKTITSFVADIEDDTGAAESANLNTLVIPYGDYELNGSTHLECQTTGSGSTHTPTFTTAFPDTNYAVVCNPTDDTDSPLCVAYNTGSQKTTTQMNMLTQDDADNGETVAGVNWCAISYGIWNFSRPDGDEVMIQAGINALLLAGNNRTADLYENMPSTDYVVITTHQDDDTTDPSVCKVTGLNLGNFVYDCEDDYGGGGGSGEYFYWVAISLDGDANLTKTGFVDDFGLAPDGVNWTANVTVPPGCSGSEDLFVDVLYSSAHINSTETGAIVCAAEDTCTYSGSGDWEIDCADNCVVDSEQKVDGDVNVYGSSGAFTLNAIITFISSNQYIRILEAGCEFIINSGGGAGGPPFIP